MIPSFSIVTFIVELFIGLPLLGQFSAQIDNLYTFIGQTFLLVNSVDKRLNECLDFFYHAVGDGASLA